MEREKITITKRKANGVLADMIADMDEASLAKTREKMEWIAEDYCSYEVAKLLKEKGFAEECVACYDWIDNSFKTIYHDTTGEVEPQDWNNLTFEEAGKMGLANWNRNISAPTHQMAMKWLRDMHELFVDISFVKDENKEQKLFWYYAIFELSNDNEAHYNNVDEFATYEEAVEAALKYCLTYMI